MNTQTFTRLAGGLAAFVAIVVTALPAAPAMAYYGAIPSNEYSSTVCAGRYDPNCILKETAYAQQIAAPYTNWQYYQTPSAPVIPVTYTAPYVSSYTPTYYTSTYYPTTQYVSYPSTYSYQYSYQYSYPSTYYVAPTYSYNDTYSNDYYGDCGTDSYNCGY